MSVECLDVVQCRACINECIEYQHLHEMFSMSNEPTTLAYMLNDCTNLEIPNEEDDILPMYLCKSCTIKLQDAYLFKQMVLQTNDVLKQNVHVEYAVEELYEKQTQKDDTEVLVLNVDEAGTSDVMELISDEQLILVKNEDTIEEYLDVDKLDEDDNFADSMTDSSNQMFLYEDSTSEEQQHESKDPDDKNEINEFTCEICGKTFNLKTALRVHLQTHSNLKEYVCEFCGKTLKNKKCYKYHLLTHTEEKKHKCEECGRQFRNPSNLQVHMRIHTGEKPYKCEHCDMSFVTLELMKRHVYLHTGERPYSCDQCDKRYRDNSNLRAHQRTHDPMKLFKCEICGVHLTQKAGYKKHMLVHTGEMPHQCHICQRRFRFSSNLRAHVLLHSGEKPHKCSSCPKAFPTAKRLRLHTKVHENKEPRVIRKPFIRRGGPQPDAPDQKVVKSNVVLLY